MDRERAPHRLLPWLALPAGIMILLGSAFALQSQSPVGPPGLSLDPAAFSPNDDGVRDVLTIRPTRLSEAQRSPANWRLEIRDGSDQVVRSFVADQRRIRPERRAGNLYLPGSKDVRPLRVFDELVWDGRDESGQRVPDGVYRLLLRIQLKEVGFVESESVPVIVDTAAPELDLSAPVALLVREPGSPSVRAAGARLEITQQSRSNVGSRYDALIVDPQGQAIRERSWDDALPERIFIYWDEVRPGPADSPEEEAAGYGTYIYQMMATDRAGNRSRGEVNDLLVSASRPEIDLRSERYQFSPNSDGSRDQLVLRVAYLNQVGRELGRRSGLVARASGYVFEILADDGQAVLFSKRGVGVPPESFLWDGRDLGGSTLSDGLYFARLRVEIPGEEISTLNKAIRIDTDPPDAGLSISRSRIRPDGDGDQEFLRFGLNFEDASGIETWNLQVLISPQTNAQVDQVAKYTELYRSFASGTGVPPDEIYWDGSSDAGVVCESLEEFRVVYEVRDRAGNIARGSPRSVQSGVLFRPVQPGLPTLSSRLPTQDYFKADFELTSRGEDALDEVLALLNRYGRYNVIIESHAALPGREEANLSRTEKRARAMHRYFLDQGFPDERVRYRGHGESELVRPGRTDFASYRNDRIEIRLELPPARAGGQS